MITKLQSMDKEDLINVILIQGPCEAIIDHVMVQSNAKKKALAKGKLAKLIRTFGASNLPHDIQSEKERIESEIEQYGRDIFNVFPLACDEPV